MLRNLLVCLCVSFAVLGVSASARAQECETDADCPLGQGCDLAPTAMIDCRPGVPCDAGPQPEARGFCEAQEIECDASSDCPLGLSCVEQEGGDVDFGCTSPGGPGFDAGTSDCELPPPSEPRAECAFEPPSCETDSDCSGGYACLTDSSGASCSTSGPACIQGEECPEPVTVCDEPVTVSYCFPARQDCASGADCDHAWLCTELPLDAQDNPPMGWEGATQICLPEGIALAVTEQIELGNSEFSGGSSSHGEANTGGGAPRGDADGDQSGGASDSGVAASGEDQDHSDDSDADAGDESGCSVARVRSEGASASGLLAGLVGLALVLRKSRRRGR